MGKGARKMTQTEMIFNIFFVFWLLFLIYCFIVYVGDFVFGAYPSTNADGIEEAED
jgi:hypothetical protein